MQNVQLTAEQKQAFDIRMQQELQKAIMSWDNELREWHSIAMRSLDCSSILQLNVSDEIYKRLYETTVHGLSMEIIPILVNNLHKIRPESLGMTGQQWVDVVDLSKRIAHAYNSVCIPMQEKILKGMEIMSNKPPLIIAKA